MAFTAGSVELARAVKLAQQIAAAIPVFGITGGGITGSATGSWTGGSFVESQARKLRFGITGLTTGSGFVPFGTVSPTAGLDASQQNPRGETMAGGITIGANTGYTLGIFSHKFITDGSSFRATTFRGVTLARSMPTVGGTSLWVRGPVNVQYQDQLIFGDGSVYVVALGGNTSAGSGETANVSVMGTITNTYATGAAFDVRVVGVTRGTSGVLGITSETFRGITIYPGGYTASVYFNYSASGGVTWSVN